MDYLSHNVSENLKKIRKAKGMSLEFETDQPHVYRNKGTEKVCCGLYENNIKKRF
mgnify:CR=1 FL=1